MNSLHIIGNVCNDAQLRTTQSGVSVCTFTVAVNPKYNKDKEKPSQFFKVSAWRKLGETCGQFVRKGMKISVVGAVELETYTNDKGETRATMCITADDVEFLTRTEGTTSAPRDDDNGYQPDYQQEPKHESVPQGYTPVETEDDLPF